MRKIAILPWVLASSGCDYYGCEWGVWPRNGATGVSVDTVIEFTSDEPLPAMLPEDMSAAFTLRADHGDGVPFDVEVGAQSFRVIPREPLLPGVTYVASGVDLLALRETDQHWWAEPERSPLRVEFQTGGQPTLLQAMALDNGHVLAVFSEPMDLETMGLAFELVDPLALTTGAGTSATSAGYYGYYYYNTDFTLSEPALMTVVGYYHDLPFVIELNPAEYAEYVGFYALAVRVDPRAASVRGPLLDAATAQKPIVANLVTELEALWEGQPTCNLKL